MHLEVKNLQVEYQNKKTKTSSLDKLSFVMEKDDFLVIVGPSGSGKTTILRVLLGLQDYQGEVIINGIDESRISLKNRNFAFISQSIILYPYLTVFENIAFPLVLQKVPLAEIKERVYEAAGQLDIGFLLSRKPREISGGQQQLVALARAIIKQPALYLFDEPLSNLDAIKRGGLRQLLYKLHKQLGVPFIFVTHDRSEALALATRIVVMNQGRIEQTGTPTEIYNQPANEFVREFMRNGGLS